MAARRKVSKDNTFRHVGRTFYLPNTVDFRGQEVLVNLWSYTTWSSTLRAAVWGSGGCITDNWDAIAETHDDDDPLRRERERWAEEDRAAEASDKEWWERH